MEEESMALIEWSDALVLGIRTIDEQHQELVAIINRLNEAMLARQSREVLGSVFDRLLQYVQFHFEEEELLFKKLGYSDGPGHVAHHEELRARVIDLHRDFRAGNDAISMELMGFLRDWLRNHILVIDKKYVPFLQEKGIT